MPYASAKQRAYFNANKKKLARRGVDVAAWNAADKEARAEKNLARLTRLVEFVRGGQAIAHAARKGWLNPQIPRDLPASLAAGFVENNAYSTEELLAAARRAYRPAPLTYSVQGARDRLAQRIRNSRGVVR